MAAADYRLMTEATGQRIAAALEALSGTGAAAAAARANLDVYSTGETDELIAQSTAWSNNWLTNTSILAYAASVANPSFTTFRTSATSTDVPIANEYYIGTVERYGQNITVKMTTMQDASKMYINNSVNGGSTWTGWKTFLDSQSTAIISQTITMQSGFSAASWGGLTAHRVGNLLIVNGNGIKSSSVISTSTLFATVSNITFADNTVSTGRVDGTSDNIPIITALKGAGGRIQINNIKYADANIFFQLIALIE